VDSNFRFLVARPSNRHGRRTALETGRFCRCPALLRRDFGFEPSVPRKMGYGFQVPLIASVLSRCLLSF